MFPGSQDVAYTLVQEGILTLGLDHVLTVQTEVEHAAVQVHGSFRVQLLQNTIQRDERPGSSDAGTAVHHRGAGARRPVHVVEIGRAHV